MCTATPCWPCVLRRLAALGEEALSLGLTPFHRRFLQLLDWVPFRLSVLLPPRRFGRPRLDRVPLLRAFFAKALGNLPTTQALRERLQADPLLRRCCGWEALRELPSAATFRRAFAQFAQQGVLTHLLRPQFLVLDGGVGNGPALGQSLGEAVGDGTDALLLLGGTHGTPPVRPRRPRGNQG
ncbi:MAG: transposase [Armatimonadetes bacterium]|nr:transposase [Armatimonadota bacterium]